MMGTRNELAQAAGGQRRDRSRVFAGLASFAALCTVTAAVGCGGATDEPTCEGRDDCPPLPRPCQGASGVLHAEGASMPADDGCNTCTCSAGGWSCTAVGCLGDACVYGGQIRADGSSFPASDGCNQCSCSDGEVACTERACEPRSCNYNGLLLPSGASVPGGDGCNSCACIDGQIACTLIDCSNDCYSDADCGGSQYCAAPVGTCIGFGPTSSSAGAETEELRAPSGQAPLPPGQCRERPALCTEDDAPVCGCDGQTYRTACAAASLGLNLASAGACAQSD